LKTSANTDPQRDSIFTKVWPLDHATSEIATSGSKLGIDERRNSPARASNAPGRP
jgi:hypothetical protein